MHFNKLFLHLILLFLLVLVLLFLLLLLYSSSSSSSLIKKEAPATPRVKNLNETASDRSGFSPLFVCFCVCKCERLTPGRDSLLVRCQSSSQDSATSSLNADKVSHRLSLTPERPQPNTSTARRKRLVRQFSL